MINCTTTQRVDAQIRRVIFLRESDKVPNNFGLRDFGEWREAVSSQRAWYRDSEVTGNLPLNFAWSRWAMASLTSLRSLDNERFVPGGLMKHLFLSSQKFRHETRESINGLSSVDFCYAEERAFAKFREILDEALSAVHAC